MNTLNYAKIGISARLNLESAGERWNAVVLCRILPKGIESLREKGCQKVLRLCLMCGKNTEDGTREGSQSCEWHLLLWRKDFSVCLGRGRLWGVSIAVGTAGNLGLPSRGPISWEEMGERTPEGRGSSLWTPFSGGCVGGDCTSHLLPGLRPSQRKARGGPPTGWAGWGCEWVPFGRRQRVAFRCSMLSYRQQTTSPARPSWRAGHEALVLEAAGQVGQQKTHAASTTVQRKRVRGKETLFPGGVSGQRPECSFTYFFQEIGPRPGGHRSRPFQRRGKPPTPPCRRKTQQQTTRIGE